MAVVMVEVAVVVVVIKLVVVLVLFGSSDDGWGLGASDNSSNLCFYIKAA